jgi:hypothetical protein
MTILISLMSDAWLGRIQKRAERFGVRGGEDQGYLETVKRMREKPSKWQQFYRRVFRIKPKSGKSVQIDLERGRDVPNIEDDMLRDEMLEQVQTMEQSIDSEVDAELGITKEDAEAAEIEEAGTSEAGSSDARRRRKNKNESECDINEGDVERALEEVRSKEF